MSTLYLTEPGSWLAVNLQQFQIVPPEGISQQIPLAQFIQHWGEKLPTPATHTQSGTVTYHLALELQVLEYISYLTGEVKFYRPMLLKP